VIPLSIPSPPREWSQLPVGEWLAGVFPWLRDVSVWINSWLPAWPADFSLVVHVYALVIIVGIVAAVLLTNFRLNRRGAEPWVIVDIAVWAVLFGIVGARLFHVVTHPDDYFGDKFAADPLAIVRVWDGGVAIYGALIGGAIGVWIACRIIGLRFWSVADAAAPGLLLAQAFGRFGNYFNQELFGLPTDLPWGLEIDRPNPSIPVGIPDDALFHPTFLYESLWNLAGVVILILIERRTREVGGIKVVERRAFWQWGKLLGLYLIWYGLGRMWFESIRLDPSETFLGFRSNVWAAFLGLVLGLLIIIYQSRNHPGVEHSIYTPGREWVPPSEVDSPDTYSESDDDEEAGAEPVTSGSAKAD